MARIVTFSTGFPPPQGDAAVAAGEGKTRPTQAMPPRPSLAVRILCAALFVGTIGVIVALLAIALPIALALFAIAAVVGLLGLAFKIFRLELRRRWGGGGGGGGGGGPGAGLSDQEGRKNVRVRIRPEDRGL